MSETFKVMERRLLRGIMNPAMVATYVLRHRAGGDPGPGRLARAAGSRSSWRWSLVLTVFHYLLARWRRDFAADRNRAAGALLSHRQRGADAGADRDRASGGG